jgi:DNA-binding protein HU-beta
MARKAVGKAPAKAAAQKAPAKKTEAVKTAKKAPAKAEAKEAKKPVAAVKAPAKAAAKAPAKAPAKVKVTAEPGKAITQTALMQLVADQQGMTRAEAKRFIDAYLDIVKAHVLKGVKVKLGDIGMIMVRERKARMGRNPRTGEPVKIKASKKLAFRQSATMRDTVR